MTDFATTIVAHVATLTAAKRRHYRSWMVHVCDIADALDCDLNAVLTAVRKAEDLKLLRAFGDPIHSVQLGEER